MLGSRIKTLKQLSSSAVFRAILLAAASVTVLTTSTLLSVKTVSVTDENGSEFTVKTICRTVGDFIGKHGIVLGEFDEVSPPSGASLGKHQAISVARAFPLNINTADGTISVQTVSRTVSAVLAQNGIILGEADIVNPSLDSVVNKETTITVTRVTNDMVAETVEIPYETVSTPNSTLARGRKNVITEGIAGEKEIMYNVTYHDGVEQSREVAGERIVREPVNRVEEYGTQYYQVASRGGRVVRDTATLDAPSEQLDYSNVLTCSATAYDLSYESCGKNPGDPYYGIAASGMVISRGVVAVDPRVIPMGSKLYIESLDSYPDYGFAVAGDKGGAIKGNKVDLFMESRSEALNFGRRSVRVYILN